MKKVLFRTGTAVLSVTVFVAISTAFAFDAVMGVIVSGVIGMVLLVASKTFD